MISKFCFNIETKRCVNAGLISKFLGHRNKIEEHYIDWDISVGLMNKQNQIEDENDFVYYNNPISKNGTITLRSYLEVNCIEGEFDEVVEIDFEKIPQGISNIYFFLSNHQQRYFDITNINLKIFNTKTLDITSSELSFTNKDICNTIELFVLTRDKFINKWKIQILNTSKPGSQGLSDLLDKYFKPEN